MSKAKKLTLKQLRERTDWLRDLIGKHAIHKSISPVAGKWEIEDRNVIVRAVDYRGTYVMVARSGCLPYVAAVNEMRRLEAVK